MALSGRLQIAFDFFRQINSQTKIGRHELDGENVYVLMQSYTTKPVAEGKFEAHRKYIDVQYVHSGTETMLWAPLALLTKVLKPYDDSSDAALFELVPAALPVRLSAGQFVILFPEDGHVPGRIWETSCEVLKAVAKVRVDNQ